MSLLDTIKGIFAGETAERGPSSRMHVIDTSGITANGGRERLSPRQQFAMVQDLAAFAQKEDIRACAILEGRPLREVADRSEYKGMQVFYAERAEQATEMAYAMARKHRGALLITQNRELESRATAAGIPLLRVSTLRKAIDDNGSRSDSGRGRGGRRSSRSRRGGGGEERSQRPRRNQRKPEDKPKEQPAREAKDGVSDLIDLV